MCWTQRRNWIANSTFSQDPSQSVHINVSPCETDWLNATWEVMSLLIILVPVSTARLCKTKTWLRFTLISSSGWCEILIVTWGSVFIGRLCSTLCVRLHGALRWIRLSNIQVSPVWAAQVHRRTWALSQKLKSFYCKTTHGMWQGIRSATNYNLYPSSPFTP